MAKFNEDTIKKLEEAFAIDATVTEACYYADISTVTYYDWIKKNPKLAEKLNRLREKPVLKARMTIAKDLDKVETAKWYVERKVKKEFSNRQEITGADGRDLPTPILKLDVQSDDSDESDS